MAAPQFAVTVPSGRTSDRTMSEPRLTENPSCLWLLCLALGTSLGAQVSLQQLPQLARARAERQRPAQERQMMPFWTDLALDYRKNQQHVDSRIAQVAALGDG